MRILWLAKRYYTNKDAFADRFGRNFEIPRQWHAAGHEVQLALIDYHGMGREYASLDGLHVRSMPALSLSTAINLCSVKRNFRPDVIVASGDCFLALAASRLARMVGASFVFDIYDDYRTFGAYRAFLGWNAFGYLLERADLVFYASSSLAHGHRHASPWVLVPNGVDPAVFRPLPISEARSVTGIAADQKLIGYFGSMEPDRGVDDLVAAVGRLHSQDSSVRLVLSGGGADRPRRQAAWVDDKGNLPHDAMPALINACDVVVLPYRRGPAIDMVSSCKMAEYLFCARPIVATRTPSLTSNFARQADELGLAIANPGDVADLARAIAFQIKNRVVASRPSSHTWNEIAATALDAITGAR